MGSSSSHNQKQFRRPRLSQAMLCLLLLVLSSSPCSARKEPGERPDEAAPHRCKLCLPVALPVAAVVSAALVILLVCICPRRNAAVDPAGTGSVEKGRRYSPWSTSHASSEPDPMSISSNMVVTPGSRSRQQTRSALPSPTNHPSSSNQRSPTLTRSRSSLRQGQLSPVQVNLRGKVVIKDPLSVYSPAISVRVKELKYERLKAATNGFGRKSLIGGRSGPWVLFKGIQFVRDDGLLATVAIKRFHTTFSEEQFERIRGELKSRSTLWPRNLVNLHGYSLGEGRFHLVYDYMTNGSLEQHLFPKAGASGLDWSLRYSIARGVIQGLDQLHVINTPHRSISASTIMLDEAWTPRLDDHFNYQPDQTSSTTVPAGGEADIADLGAVLLELVCGRRTATSDNATTAMPLIDWVWELHGEGRLLDAVDAALEADFDRAQASKLLLLGLACSHLSPKLRPNSHDVRMVLEDKNLVPEVPSFKPTSS